MFRIEVPRFSSLYDATNQVESQRGLAALELDGEVVGRRLEDEIDCSVSISLAHVEAAGADSRSGDLAVMTAVIATQRHDKDVQ